MLDHILPLLIIAAAITHVKTTSSPLAPFTTYKHSVELQKGVADLWWSVDDDENEILFELHVNTTGWISLGISPAGGMRGADIGVGWVDMNGQLYFQDRYAKSSERPIFDNTTSDWFGVRGREANGWTAIQFKRFLDTCDIMDVPIKSGTNNVIFAYGLTDPNPSGPMGEISYHGSRRGSRTIPLRSYANPPSEDLYAGLDYFEFRLNNYVVPPNDTTYHCKIYKAPANYSTKRHAIGHKTIVDPANVDLVHHLLMYECDATAQFNDSNLPEGLCDEIFRSLKPCYSNIATGWAVGGDYLVEFPKEAGYPVGGDFKIKYYMVQMHYDNPRGLTNRSDSSGIRFYLGRQLRQYDLGYLTLGTDSNAVSLAIPPKVEKFVVDSYCSANATMGFPQAGITIVSTFPHTHLQGRSVWTKLVRNKTAAQYLFNAEAYDFNYQYENRLPTPIKLHRGDELYTRCVYNTMDKETITLGGERTKDEMCLHMLTYYPRMDGMYGCVTTVAQSAWESMLKIDMSSLSYYQFRDSLLNISWTPRRVSQWQNFYNNASRVLIYGASPSLKFEPIPTFPDYEDLKTKPCIRVQENNQTTANTQSTSSSTSQPVTVTPSSSATGQDMIVLFHLVFMLFITVFIL